MSSSSVQAASYLNEGRVRWGGGSKTTGAQVVVRASVGFVFLLQLPLHCGHVVRCGTASTLQHNHLLRHVSHTAPHLRSQEQHSCGIAAAPSHQSDCRQSRAGCKWITNSKSHLLIRGAATVSVAVSFVHKLAAGVTTRVYRRRRRRSAAYHLSDVASRALQLLSEALVHGVQTARTLHRSAHDARDQHLALLVLGGDLK